MCTGCGRQVYIIRTFSKGSTVMIRKILFTAAVFLPVILLMGCSVEKARNAVAYMTGELQTEVDAPLADTVEASRAALEELQFTDIDARKDAFKGRVEARDADRALITVLLENYSEHVTKVGIRVGTFGNEKVSREILNRIKKHL